MRQNWIVIPALFVIFGAGSAFADEALAKKSGCLRCHSVDKHVVGPAYRDVAKKYKNVPGARGALIQTVKNGGKGHWSHLSRGVPMPPHSKRLPPADIERLVDWVLSLEMNQQ